MGNLAVEYVTASATGTAALVVLGGTLLFGAYYYLNRRSTKKIGPVFLFSDGNASGAQPSWEARAPEAGSPSRSTALPTASRPGLDRSRQEPRTRGDRPEPSMRGRGWEESPTQRMTISPEVRDAAVGSSFPPPPEHRTSTDAGSGSLSGNRTSPVTQEAPPDGTLQLLPGSLKVESGDSAGEIIRFVRVPGEEVVITFGRNPGPPHRHVELRSPTVSRLHARLTFRDRKWTLRNESATNPAIVNGRPLEGRPAEVLLHDGDRIEMGEIAFVFQHSEPSNRLALRSSWYTDRGRRATNQDAVAVRTLPEGRELVVVCDGMGSHTSGGMASYIALEALVEALTKGEDLARGVQEANRAIRRAADEDVAHDGMGTTMVALLREGERYMVANVGDSRAYRLDQKGIGQLTRDHSFVAEAVGEGGMSLEEAKRSPWRHAVTRNLGSEADVEVDLFGPFDATAPHLAILSSDGVHGVLSDHEIERLVQDTPDIRDLARALAEAALANGGEDNVAVAVMDFSSGVDPI